MKKNLCVLLVPALVLFIVSGMFLNAEAPSKKVGKLIGKAESALKEKKLEKALEYYNKALAEAPEYGPVYYGIARIQAAQNQFEEALTNLNKATELDAEHAPTKELLINVLFQLGKQAAGQKMVEKSNQMFENLIAVPGVDTLKPKMYMDALYNLGNGYGMLKNLAKSNEFFQKVLDLPGISTSDKKLVLQLLYKIGLNYYQLQKSKESYECFEKMILMPDAETENQQLFVTAHYLAGLNASLAAELKKSNDYLIKFLAQPTASEQLLPLANFLIGTNMMTELDEAVDAVKKDAEKDKKKRIAELASKSADIETYLNKALELKPDLEPAYMHLGNFYYYSGDDAKAISKYEELIEKYPTSPDVDGYKRFLEDIKKSVAVDKKK